MRLSTNTDVLAKEFGLQKAVEILIDAGFDAIDFSQFVEEFYSDVHEKSFYTEIRKFVEDKGVYFNQAHAPFGSSFFDAEKTEKRFHEIVESMRIASYLGVKQTIVHPCTHLVFDDPGAPEELYEINMNFYRRLIPYCEEYGIKVAVENMWDSRSGVIGHCVCSRPAEFVRYMDDLDDEHFVACLDIGHAVLVREKPDDMIRALGNKRLQGLHVHDVDGNRDSHTLPFYGVANWEKVMKALGEIDYQGELTFEATNFYSAPSVLWASASKYMADVGKYLISRIEAHRAK